MIVMPGGYRRTTADTARMVAALHVQLARSPGDADLLDAEAWPS